MSAAYYQVVINTAGDKESFDSEQRQQIAGSIDPLSSCVYVGDSVHHTFDAMQHRTIHWVQKSGHYVIPCYLKIVCQHARCPLRQTVNDDSDCDSNCDSNCESDPSWYTLEVYDGQDYIREVTVHVD